MASELRYPEKAISPGGIEVPRDAEGVGRVALPEAEAVPHMVRDVAVGLRYGDIGMRGPDPVEEEPAHRRHLRRAFEPFVFREGDGKWMRAVMVVRVAPFAESDQVCRPVGASILALDDVVDFQVLMAVTVPTGEIVPCLHICLYVGVAELIALLITPALDVIVLDLLDVK